MVRRHSSTLISSIGFVGHAPDRLRIGDIAGGPTPAGLRLVAGGERRLVHVADPEPRPGTGKALGDGPADAGGPGGGQDPEPRLDHGDRRPRRVAMLPLPGRPSRPFSQPQHLPPQVEVLE